MGVCTACVRTQIWASWTPEQDKVEDEDEEEAGAGGAATGGSRAREVMEVVVTEVVDAGEFYVQRVGEPRVQWVADQVRAAGAADPPAIPVSGHTDNRQQLHQLCGSYRKISLGRDRSRMLKVATDA